VARPGTISGVGNATRQRISGVVNASAPRVYVGGPNRGGQSAGRNTGRTYNPVSTYNPQAAGQNYGGGGGGSVAGASTGGGDDGGYDPAAAQAAAAAAKKAAELNAARSAVTSLVGNIRRVYDALYGDIGVAARDQQQQLSKRYATETQGVTDQFNSAFPQIGSGYASRGAYDSSYRINAEDSATQGFKNSVNQLETARQGDEAKIGRFLTEKRASIRAEQGGLNSIRREIDSAEDVNELKQLRNQLDTKLRTIRSQRAGYKGQGEYIQNLNKSLTPNARFTGIRNNLANIVGSQVPTAVKRAIAEQVIDASGLSDKDKDSLVKEVNGQLAAETNPNPVA